ncbi:MAG: outer membrane lipoprotein-sorting protein [Gammaproteobacteria bacterium]|nr:outer membrane lipoprotein-sorting protein [Gammaproteobacteria bacterium]MDH5728966.1 outer membrane lipoprotein-sorting protein [Gammaproteobacteria bacterium]
MLSQLFSRALYLTSIFVFCFTSPGFAAETDVSSLMRHIDRLWRADSSRALMSMTVKTHRYERSMTLESWSKGKDKSLIIIKAPKKDKGIATLKVDKKMWNYLPKINRVTKVPASMMSGSWMGSHFTNDDLVQENTYEDDFETQITFSGQRDGQRIYEVTSIPKPTAAVVWGKVVMIIDQARLTPLQAIYYDEDSTKIRTMFFEDIRKQGKRHIPMRMRLVPEEKPQESTIIEYQTIEFDIALKDNLFSLQSLKKQR